MIISLSTMTRTCPRLTGPLTTHVGFWLRFLSNHVSGSFRQKLAAKDISVAEWVLLRTLSDQNVGVAPSQLATQLGMTRGGITKLVDKLQVRSLVVRIPDPRDGRGQVLSLTPTGRRFIPVLAKLADENDREWFGHLPTETVTSMIALLRDIVDYHQLHVVPTE